MRIIVVIMLTMMVVGYAYSDEESTKNILKQGILGAGVGAISAGASGGKAGQGALIGAGTSVIGSALLDAITGPSSGSSSSRTSGRQQQSAPPPSGEYYYSDEPEEYYVEEAPPQGESGTQKVLKQGLVGAGVGAISAGASGGKAGQGALIGAGTSVIGNALLDTITQPSQERKGKVYRKIPPKKQYSSEDAQGTPGAGTHKKVIKKYDESGKIVSEEEIYY